MIEEASMLPVGALGIEAAPALVSPAAYHLRENVGHSKARSAIQWGWDCSTTNFAKTEREERERSHKNQIGGSWLRLLAISKSDEEQLKGTKVSSRAITSPYRRH